MKKILIAIALVALAGCASNSGITKITGDVKPIAVPIIYSPAPPAVVRPTLPFQTMTPDQQKSDGEVVKAYAASVQALIGYAEQLEAIVKQYQQIHDSYSALAAKVAADWKAKTGTDLQIPAEPNTTISTNPSPPTKLVVPPTKLN